MKKIYAILCVACALTGCRHEYKFTARLRNGLYVETYSTGIMGVLTEDRLTDSVDFRIYIGTFDDENGGFYYRCNGDSIIVQELDSSDRAAKQKIVSEKIYSIAHLKKYHGWLK